MIEIAHRAWHCLWRERATFAFTNTQLPDVMRLRACADLIYVLTIALDNGLAGDGIIASFVAFAADAIEAVDWAVLARRDPRFYVAILLWHAFATASGNPRSAHWRSLAERGVSAGLIDALQLAPHRRLEVTYLLQRAGLRSASERALREIYETSVAGRGVALPCYARPDHYALSHSIFYLTDHGRRSARSVLRGSQECRLRELVQRALFLAASEQEVDLLAEISIGSVFLGLPHSTIDPFALRIARVHVDAAGWVRNGNGASGLDAFIACYHATLVWATAFSLLSKNARR